MKHFPSLARLSCSIPTALALFGLGMLNVGCQKASSPPLIGSAQSLADAKVVVLTCDEYFDPDVLLKFTQETGIEVEIQPYLSTAEMEERLKSNPQNYDVVVAEQGAIAQLRTGRLLLPLDSSQLTNRGNLDARYLNMPFDPQNKFSIPYMWGITTIAYRKDHFPTPPEESINLLYDPALAGKVSLLDDRNECFALGLLKMGHEVKDTQPQQMLEATDALIELVRKQRARFGSDNEVKEHLISGESSVAMIYNGDAQIIAQEHENISCFIPKEGAVMWVDSFAIPRDALHSTQAHKFINFLIQGEIAAQGSNYLRYASPNKTAEPFIDATLLSDPIVYPSEAVRARLFSMPVWTREALRVMNNGWHLVNEAREINLVQSPPATLPPPPMTPLETVGKTPPVPDAP